MKYCSKCKILKSLVEFTKDSSKKGGLRYQCKPCVREYHLRRSLLVSSKEARQKYSLKKRQENARLSVAYLRNHPCVDCGENDPVVLDFDHVRGNKTDHISAMIQRCCSWKTIKEEINKCEIRCANCHRRKTFGHLPKFAETIGL